MTVHQYKYYVAGGKSLEAVREWQRQMAAAAAGVDALKAEFGAKGIMRRGSAIVGLIFEGDGPAGWRKEWGAGVRFYRPSRKTKADKAAWARLRTVDVPGADAFARLLGLGSFGIWAGLDHPGGGITIRYPTFETLSDEQVIISIPLKNGKSDEEQFVPPDCTPLKTSKYFALKEAEPAELPDAEAWPA